MQHDEKDPVAMWMKELADLETSQPLPDADLIWLKAQILEKPAGRWMWADVVAWIPVSAALLWLAIHVSEIARAIEACIPVMLPMPMLTIAATVTLGAFALALPLLLSHD